MAFLGRRRPFRPHLSGLLVAAPTPPASFFAWLSYYMPVEVQGVFKNVASQKATLFAFDASTGLPKTGDAANITGYVSKDDGTVTVLGTPTPTEDDATNAKGMYTFTLTQAETNGDKLKFTAKSSTSNVVPVPAVIYTFPTTGILAPTTSGRTLDVSATGEAGLDWANIGSPTTANALTGTTIAATQQVDVNTIKTQTVTCAAGVTIRADVGAAAAPGSANGMLIGGSNAATTFAGLTTGALSCTTLTASGAVAFQSTFTVTTSTSLAALSCTTLTASGAVAFQSTFAVTTSTSLAALSCTTLTASGAVAFQSTFIVTGAVTFSSTFATTGTATFNALTVTNATTLSGAVSLGSTLGVTGTTTFAAVNTGAVGTGNVTITGTLSTSGTATFNAFTVTNAFTVSGATTLTGAVTGTNASNDLRVNGALPGASGGLTIAGTNAATSFATGSHFIGTVDTVTNQLTAAAIATGVWQDTTSGDFTVTSSIGKSLYTGLAPGNTLGGLICNNAVASVSALVVAGSTTLNSLSVSSTTTFTGAITGTNASNDLRINGIVPGLANGLLIAGSNAATTFATLTSTGAFTINGTSDVAQTGDSFARIGLAGVGLTNVVLPSGGLANVTVWTVALTGNITGNLSGSVGSVSGAVGSVTGAVGSVTGAVGSVTGNVGGSVGSVASGVTVTTNNDKTGYSLTVTPPTAAQIATAVLTDTTDLGTSGSIGYVIAHQLGGAFTTSSSSVFTTAALANAPGGGGSVTVGGYASGQDPATLVLDVAAASHNTAGTIGAKINAAGGAADPLTNPVPGSYASGEAGWVLGQLLSKSITYTGAVNPVTGAVSLIRGDDYYADDGRALLFALSTGNGNPDLTGATVTAAFYPIDSSTPTLSVTATTTSPGTTNQECQVELSAANSTLLVNATYLLSLSAVLADGHRATVVRTAAGVSAAS